MECVPAVRSAAAEAEGVQDPTTPATTGTEEHKTVPVVVSVYVTVPVGLVAPAKPGVMVELKVRGPLTIGEVAVDVTATVSD
jgi:hypothetical protein